MKIAILTNTYPPEARGGAGLIAYRVVRELQARGHDVFVIPVAAVRGPNVYRLEDASRYPFPIRILWHLIDTLSPVSGQKLARILEEKKPDVVLSHNLKGLGLSVARAVRRAGIPWIHTLHDVQLSIPSGLLLAGEEQSFMNAGFPRRWYERAVQRVVGSPDVVISPSKFLADFYASRGFFPRSDVRVIPNPAPTIRRPSGPSSLSGPSSPLRLLFAGQLEEHKGIRVLERALDATDVPFKLTIAGQGTLEPFVREWAARDSHVTYHGQVSFDQLVALFAETDATLVPSLCYENSPTVIYESFSAGVPVIASDIGGVGELVEDGVNGLLVTSGDVGALVEAIRRFAGQGEVFRGRSDAIRACMEPLSLAHYVDRLELLINRVVATKRD